jgi:hypothetical protein
MSGVSYILILRSTMKTVSARQAHDFSELFSRVERGEEQAPWRYCSLSPAAAGIGTAALPGQRVADDGLQIIEMRLSTAASQIYQEKWPKHVWPPLCRGRMISRLKAILSWYEGADRRCRHEIFGDIFLLTFRIFTVRRDVDFPAHDAEQAFISGIEHARS